MKKVSFETMLAVALIVFGISMRLLPHPPNFTPIGAIALFGSMYLPKRFAVALPFSMMLVSDSLIGFYDLRIMTVVYISFFAMQAIGFWLRERKTVLNVLGGTMLGSGIFFLFTNAAVFAFGTMYAHTFSGLMKSYLMGLPFFKYTLAGDLFYTALLVGGFKLAYWVRKRQQRTLAQATY